MNDSAGVHQQTSVETQNIYSRVLKFQLKSGCVCVCVANLLVACVFDHQKCLVQADGDGPLASWICWQWKKLNSTLSDATNANM